MRGPTLRVVLLMKSLIVGMPASEIHFELSTPDATGLLAVGLQSGLWCLG